MPEVLDGYTTMNCTADFMNCKIPKKVDPISLIATRQINNVSDIEGATSKLTRLFVKPNFMSNSDIEGSTSKILHHSRNVMDKSLYVDDIDGARHFIKDRMLTTKRVTDPINPTYKLPSFPAPEPYIPRFVNNSYDVSDIEGAQPRIPKQFAPRETFRDDIVGAKANWKPRHERARLEAEPHDIMKTSDVSERKLKPYELTSRVTDLNAPKYQIFGMEIEDDPRYSKPKPLKKYIPNGTFSLTTKDVPGATSKFAEHNVRPRKEFRNLTSTLDIEGAQADTLKHSMVTKRETNPLNPIYPSLDGGKPIYNVIEPLLPAEVVKKPLIRIGEPSSSQQPIEPKNAMNNLTDFTNHEINSISNIDDDNIFLINAPNDDYAKEKIPSGRLKLSLPTISNQGNQDTSLFSGGRGSYRSQPSSRSIDKNELIPSGRGSYRGEAVGSQGGSGRTAKVNKTSFVNSPFTSARSGGGKPLALTSNERKIISARKEEIELVRQLN